MFDPTLEADYERLASIAGSWLYYYGPPLWKLGITEHDGCVEPPTGDPEALGALLDRCQLLELPVGTKLFRLRLNPSQDPREAATYDTPPRQVLREYQRFDSPELPLFYASPDPETCVHECRTTLADFVALATFETVYPLWLLDLRDDFDEPEGDPHAHFAPLVWRLTGGGPDEYPRCRLLASAMRRFDYLHGFAYRSYYSAIKPRPLTNYALFGFPVKRGLLRLHSLNRIILDRVDYVLRFAPLDT